jgi:putative transposase
VSRYRLIREEKAAYPVVLLCRVLGVACSAYYAWARRGVSARARADEDLATADRGGARAQSPDVWRPAGPRGAAGADPAHAPAPNLVARDFAAPAANRLWLGDITYVATREGWLYLAVLLDAHSRRVVGWAVAEHLRAELALDALAMALRNRRPGAGPRHHTDRGSQYTAAPYRAALAAHDITCSMSRAGECLDNAMAESFFATIKAELRANRPWPTRAAARTAVFAWIEVWYNRQRAHSALAYRAPVAHEAHHLLLLQDLAA